MKKWTKERRAKFNATLAAKKGHTQQPTRNPDGLPPELERALERHYRKKFLRALMKK